MTRGGCSDVSIHAAHQLVAPSSIRSEALQLLLESVLSGKGSEVEAMVCHDKMTELKMRLLGDRGMAAKAAKLARIASVDDLVVAG